MTTLPATLNQSPKGTHIRAMSHTSLQTNTADGSDDETVPVLRRKIQKLKGERSQVLNDLMMYENAYDTKMSLHARLETINDMCNRLFSMTNLTIEAISGEVELATNLEAGMKKVKMIESEDSSQSVADADVFITSPPEFLSPRVQYCINISALTCIVSISQKGEVCARLSMPGPANILQLSWSPSHSEYQRILSGLYLKSSQSRFQLVYSSTYRHEFITLIVALEGIPVSVCCVTLQEEGPDVLISLSEPEIFPTTLQVKVPRSKLELVSSLAESNDLNSKRLIEHHLAVVQSEGQAKLRWSNNTWDLKKRLFKGKFEPRSPGLTQCPLTTDETLKTYTEFNTVLYKSYVMTTDGRFQAELHRNDVLGLYRITIHQEDFSWVMKEEEERESFKFVSGLQFSSLQEQPKTLFASLELRKIISGFFSMN